MAKPLKTCSDCGELSDQARCPKHRKEFEQTRGSAAARGYDGKWRAIVKVAITNHLQKFGTVCPGYNVPPHTATKASLTGDHRIPLSMGGKNEPANVDVLCRPCNSRKGGRNRVSANSVSTSSGLAAESPKKRTFLIYDYGRAKP